MQVYSPLNNCESQWCTSLVYSSHPWLHFSYPTLILISYYPHDGLQGPKRWATALPGITSLTSCPTYVPQASTAPYTQASLLFLKHRYTPLLRPLHELCPLPRKHHLADMLTSFRYLIQWHLFDETYMEPSYLIQHTATLSPHLSPPSLLCIFFFSEHWSPSSILDSLFIYNINFVLSEPPLPVFWRSPRPPPRISESLGELKGLIWL